MAHQVERMFSYNEKPWHYGLTGPDITRVLSERPATTDEAFTLAGLDWEPVAEPAYRKVPAVLTADGVTPERYEAAPGHHLITRSDNGYVLAATPKTFHVIGHDAMKLIIDTLMEGRPMLYETGGCLDHGRTVWMMLQAGDLFDIPGDPSPHARYVALVSSHDGSGACRVLNVNTRIVCANTVAMADLEAGRRRSVFAFQHRANWRDHLATLQREVQDAMSGAGREDEALRGRLTELAGMPVTSEQTARFIDEVIYPTRDEHRLTRIAYGNVLRARDTLREIYGSPTMDGIRGSAYGLVQLVTEFSDHHIGKKSPQAGQHRFKRAVVNSSDHKRRGVALAVAAADGRL